MRTTSVLHKRQRTVSGDWLAVISHFLLSASLKKQLSSFKTILHSGKSQANLRAIHDVSPGLAQNMFWHKAGMVAHPLDIKSEDPLAVSKI